MAIETEAEPFPHSSMFTFERLGTRFLVGAAGCVTGVADASATGKSFEDFYALADITGFEDFIDRSNIAIGVDALTSFVVEDGDACRKLTSML